MTELAMHPSRGQGYRGVVDARDWELVAALCGRFDATKSIGGQKAENNQPVFDAARHEEVLHSRRVWAEAMGADPDTVARVGQVMELIMALSCQQQENIAAQRTVAG